jgi:hypothetical protein
VLEAVLPPLIATYMVFVAMVVVAWRRPVGRPRGIEASPSSRSTLRMIVGGYGSFLAIVLIFHVWLAGEADALTSALWGGGFLSAVALGVSAASALLGGRRSPRR